MEKLEQWLREQIEEHEVEPSCGLGEAIRFMPKHWTHLTLFLRVLGAPLDNNIRERALKVSICDRKNSLFHRTLNGAHVSNAFMGPINVNAELNGVDPFDCLVVLQRAHMRLAESPGDWMP